MMQFELNKERPSIIKVVGIGGGGSNAVNHMFRQGIKGVDFVVCNTDAQALDMSPVPKKIQLGKNLTEGLGAGSNPEAGRNAAMETVDEIRNMLSDNTKMVFITAGMGGGTGTGAAPVIAGIAKELGILTVGIVTVPFNFEGPRRRQQATSGIEQLKKNVDTLLIICNDKLREIHGNLSYTQAFAHADNILNVAAKSIAEIITITYNINVDFADVVTVMKESGVAIMGCAAADGENRATQAIEHALESPLLNDNNIEGARYILLNITSAEKEVTLDEVGEITGYIQEQSGYTAEIIMGIGKDDTLGDKLCVTVIATGFKTQEEINHPAKPAAEKKVHQLIEEPKDEFKPETSEKISLTDPMRHHQQTDEDESEDIKASPVPEPYIIIRNEEKPVTVELDPVSSGMPVEPMQDKEPEETKMETEPEIFSVTETPIEIKETTKTVSIPYVPQEEEDPVSAARRRIMEIRRVNFKINTPQGLTDLEKEPAYKRRNVKLENVPPSTESNVSRYTLSEDSEKKPELKANNTFIHDRVD
jgi:cell division protein FtsZ